MHQIQSNLKRLHRPYCCTQSCKYWVSDFSLSGELLRKIWDVWCLATKNPQMWTDQGEILHCIGLKVPSTRPNLLIIGLTCRTCWAKNLKIAPQRIAILAFLPVINAMHWCHTAELLLL